MSSSLRRSQRGKATSYKQGDYIEIVKNKNVLSGLLLRKLEDSIPSNPVWIVRFEGKVKDQAIPEKSFGRLVTASTNSNDLSSSAVASSSTSAVPITTSSKALRGRPPRSSKSNATSSDNNSSTGSSMQITGSVSNAAASSVATSTKPKKKIHKKRKQQQQQQMHEKTSTQAASKAAPDEKEDQHLAAATATLKTGINTRSTSSGKRSHAALGFSLKQVHKKSKKQKNKEEVVKVQYSTGTLFVYKGENPRVVYKWHY